MRVIYVATKSGALAVAGLGLGGAQAPSPVDLAPIVTSKSWTEDRRAYADTQLDRRSGLELL